MKYNRYSYNPIENLTITHIEDRSEKVQTHNSSSAHCCSRSHRNIPFSDEGHTS